MRQSKRMHRVAEFVPESQSRRPPGSRVVGKRRPRQHHRTWPARRRRSRYLSAALHRLCPSRHGRRSRGGRTAPRSLPPPDSRKSPSSTLRLPQLSPKQAKNYRDAVTASAYVLENAMRPSKSVCVMLGVHKSANIKFKGAVTMVNTATCAAILGTISGGTPHQARQESGPRHTPQTQTTAQTACSAWWGPRNRTRSCRSSRSHFGPPGSLPAGPPCQHSRCSRAQTELGIAAQTKRTQPSAAPTSQQSS